MRVFVMKELTLKHGPKLELKHSHFDEITEEAKEVTSDITSRAGQFLFKKVTLAADVLLSDLLKLLQLNPVLLEIYHGHWAEDFLTEAISLNFTGTEVVADDEAIEYLEIYQQWSHDCDTNEMAYMVNEFHGMGFLRKAESKNLGSVGTRTPWSLTFLPLKELLNLPVHINPQVQVVEDNIYSTKYGQIKYSFQNPNLQLGEILEAVLFELSFHGNPAMKKAEGDSLLALSERVKSGVVETTPFDFSGLYAGTRQVFEIYDDDFSEEMLWQLLKKLPDNENAQIALSEKEGEQFQLKDQYKALSGLQLRATLGELTKDNDFF